LRCASAFSGTPTTMPSPAIAYFPDNLCVSMSDSSSQWKAARRGI
jgi:hypothetical protein